MFYRWYQIVPPNLVTGHVEIQKDKLLVDFIEDEYKMLSGGNGKVSEIVNNEKGF